LSEGAHRREPARRGEWISVIALCLLGFALRSAVVGQYESSHPLADRPVIDEASYESWALEISRGDWMGDEVFFQEPLYPYWMATIYAVTAESRTALRQVQAGLGALTVFLVWALARRLFGRGPALIAAFALATYRPALLFPSLLLKPNLFLPIFAGLACLLVTASDPDAEASPWERHSRWLFVGFLAGLGALLRGNMLILLPLFVIWPAGVALFGRTRLSRQWLSCVLVALGAAAALTPVALRNHHVGGVWALTTSGAGTNVYGGNNPGNPYGVAKEFDWVRGIPEFEAEDWKHEAERREGRELSPTEVSSFWLGEVGSSVLEDPLLHVSILWNKLRLTLGAYEVPDNHHLGWDARFVSLLRAPLPGYELWGWLSLAGMLVAVSELLRKRAPEQDRGAASLALLYLAYLATIVLTVTSMRARIALVPLLLPFGGWFVVRSVQAVRERRAGVMAVAALLSAALVFVPVFDASERDQKLAARDLNELTYRFGERGATEELLFDVRELDQRYPGTLRIWSLIAEVEFGLARSAAQVGDAASRVSLLKSARDRLEKVIAGAAENERERHRARVLLGDVASFAGVPSAARVSYERALIFDPTDAHVKRGLAEALLLLAVKEPDGAEQLLVQAVEEFSGSLELDPEGPNARLLGLANAQFLLSELREGPEKSRLLESAEENLLRILETESSPDVDRLLDLVRASS